MFRTINSKFYGAAVLLAVVFAWGYGLLSFYLDQQDRLATEILEISQIERAFLALRPLFYEARFWERVILDEDNPEANARFGVLMKDIKTKTQALQDSQLNPVFKPDLENIQARLLDYETAFNQFVQLKTSLGLHRTVMGTSYKSLVANVLNSNVKDVERPLFNLSDFFTSYLVMQRESGFNALVLVTDYLAKKIEQAQVPDGRTMQYLVSFKSNLEKDHALLTRMREARLEFDRTNSQISHMFDHIFQASNQLLKQGFVKAETRRTRLNRNALVLVTGMAVVLFVIFFFSAKSIVTPIRAVFQTMMKIKGGNSQARFEYDGNPKDELVRFGQFFNQMIDTLQESEEKYKILFESSMDGVLLFDPESHCYVDCNPAALEMFGIRSKDLLTRISARTLSPEFQPDGSLSSEKALKMIQKAERQGSAMYDWTHQRTDGELFFASVVQTGVTLAGRRLFQRTVRDITDYKNAQEMVIQSEKMLSVGGLAAGMAHEINNPLAGVIQTAELMTRRLNDPELPANQNTARLLDLDLTLVQKYMQERGILHMLENIREAGGRMAAIVSNMLSFARKNDAVVSAHAVGDLVDSTLDLIATDFDLKKGYDFKAITVKKEFDSDLPPVPCEKAKIQQVLLNIFRNGAQAMQDAKVAAPCFVIRAYNDEARSWICIEIEDNGPGMDEETVKRVFEPFFTTKPVGLGTGLGLSVSYFIITENHNGQMRVESAPGQGARFIIQLPLAASGGVFESGPVPPVP